MTEFWSGAFYGYLAGLLVTAAIFSIVGKWIAKLKKEFHDHAGSKIKDRRSH